MVRSIKTVPAMPSLPPAQVIFTAQSATDANAELCGCFMSMLKYLDSCDDTNSLKRTFVRFPRDGALEKLKDPILLEIDGVGGFYFSDLAKFIVLTETNYARAAMHSKTLDPEIEPYFTEFSSASKIKSLTTENVVSWVQMLKLPEAFATVMFINQNLFRSVGSEVEDEAPVSTWGSYHISAQSTTTLVNKYLDEAGDVATKIFSAADIKVARESDPEELDHGISPKMIAHTFWYLTAAEYRFGKWYQGIKAVQSMPAAYGSAFVPVYVRYIQLTTNIGDLSKVSDKDELVSLIQKVSGRTAGDVLFH